MCSMFTAKLQLRKACLLSWKCVIDWLIMALHERRIHITNLYYNKSLIRKISGVSLSNFKRLNLLKSTSSMIAPSSRGPQNGAAPSSLDDCGNVSGSEFHYPSSHSLHSPFTLCIDQSRDKAWETAAVRRRQSSCWLNYTIFLLLHANV
jgi:hypothetical protein